MSLSEGKLPHTDYVEEVGDASRNPTLGQKLKVHFRKWWWAHLIFFIASTLIIVLCLIYVAFPRISQNGIDDSTLEIKSLVLSDPTPDSFHLKQTAVIGNKSPYHPRLDAFNASLSLAGPTIKPYAYVTIPEIFASETATTIIDQDVKIMDHDQFNIYTGSVLSNESVSLAIEGKTGLHEMRFPTTTVAYKKVIAMKGLNKLTGFNITDFSIKLTPDPDGTNMVGTVYIPNPTVMTISMGNVTFNTYVKGDYIGNSTLTNLVLMPGNNTLPMRSVVNQTIVLEKVISDYKNGMLPIDITGNSSIYNGKHLPYFEEALASNAQSITLDVGTALKAIGFTIPGS